MKRSLNHVKDLLPCLVQFAMFQDPKASGCMDIPICQLVPKKQKYIGTSTSSYKDISPKWKDSRNEGRQTHYISNSAEYMLIVRY
jgi:hypothetical protein